MGASKDAVAQGEGNELPPIPNERAQNHLDNYGDGMKNTYGPEVQWVRGPFDAQVMYNNTGRKPHGKFAIADGAIDSSTIIFSTTAHPSQPQSAQSSTQRVVQLQQEVQELKRQRQEDQGTLHKVLQYTQQMCQYMMRQGQRSTPPPQLNFASLFSSFTNAQDGTSNYSNEFQQQPGRNPGNTQHDDPSSYEHRSNNDDMTDCERNELRMWFGPNVYVSLWHHSIMFPTTEVYHQLSYDHQKIESGMFLGYYHAESMF
ncbi:hypothetical protein PVAP13_5NG125081 [Panicum virgatum]|uniref:Uncharacterized protein n=2 Tax=Panicum virgatum TaxID=38727 RepID=A0A8T0RV85_PANVG|nr:hypothetical protein PVAP13_5NG125081 [Panicum virgatum]